MPTPPAAVAVARRMAFATLLAMANAARAEEIAPFKLTGMDGYATLRYLSDQQSADQPGLPRSRQAQAGWRNEIFAMSHSYIYHPNLLTLDVGGGPIFHGENFVGDSGGAQARGMLYNFSARANFLKDKPYTGSLFFSHLNPTVSLAPGQVFQQENVRYGFDLSLLAPATPLPLQIGFLRSQVHGRGADRLVDDRGSQFNVKATRAHDALGYTQVQYQTGWQASRSGSLDLPLQSSTASNQAINIDTRLQLGGERQYDLTNVISINRQHYAVDSGAVPALSDFRLLLDGRARHSDKFNSYGFYSYSHGSQGQLDTAIQAASAGLSYWPWPGVETSLGAHGDDRQTQMLQARSLGVDGNLRYEIELPLGTLQASYGARQDRRQQVAAAPQTSVIGENLTLGGTGYVSLGHPHVVAGTPLLSNASRSQTYVENIDYALLVVGAETRLQRLIGGRILDGDQVLVDYAYDNGGTYAYTQVDQSLNLNWNLSRYFSVYFRRAHASPRLTTGMASFPLNEIASTTWGGHADLPLNLGLPATVGGNLEREARRETIAPYRRAAADFYLQTDEPLFGLGFLRASTRRSRIEYDDAWRDSDLRGQELRYWSREWFGIDFTAALSRERDASGLLPRQRRDGSIGALWQERKFTFSASFVRSHESQGDAERLRRSLQVQVRREL